MPLEFYPPSVNALEVLSNEKNISVKVWTTHNNKERKPYENKLFKIVRAPFPNTKDPRLIRLLKYITFNITSFFGLIFYNPDKVLYYESYSVWPVYWYLKLFGKKKDLFIHYHEYSPPEWYQHNMAVVRHYYRLEKTYLYPKAKWISHTNKDRIAFFLKDHPDVGKDQMYMLPNYPPLKWQKEIALDKVKSKVLKAVYIGSLSIRTTYIKEFCDWVAAQNGTIIFDIYAFNLDTETHEYLTNLKTPYIHYFKEGIEYDAIPRVLSTYDIGLILYRAFSTNYKFNAPNKLFEYLACGLQVWYSEQMLGIKPYNSERVKPLDFEVLDGAKLFNSSTFEKKNVLSNQFVAEHALEPLLIELGN
jgi:hypothetical protein